MLGIEVDYEKRIFGLDLLRFFAIFCVVHGHGAYLLPASVSQFVRFPHGVDIFFVLSGFLIGNSFISNGERNGGKIAPQKMLAFWKRTAFRILPDYLLILFVNYFLVRLGVLPGNTEQLSVFRFMTYTQNLFTPFYGFFWESWSLTVQMWFYLLFPFMLLLLSRKIGIRKGSLWVSGFFIVVAILYRLLLRDVNMDFFWWDVTFRKVAVSRVDSIYVGVIVAWLRFYHPEIWKRCAVPCFVLGVAGAAVMAWTPYSTQTFYAQVVMLSIHPIYIAMWFPLLDRIRKPKTVFGRAICHISVLSYAMYLLNLLWVVLIKQHLPEQVAAFGPLMYVMYWTVTIVTSYLLYRLIEKPMVELQKKL